MDYRSMIELMQTGTRNQNVFVIGVAALLGIVVLHCADPFPKPLRGQWISSTQRVVVAENWYQAVK